MRQTSVPRVVVFPYYVDNPYTELLYSSVRAVGYDVEGFTKLDAFQRAVAELGAGDVIHVQWTSPIAHVGRDAHDSWHRVDLFQRIVRAAQKRGVALIWTVHNAVPHDAAHLAQEVALCRFLVDRAGAVHVMNPATRDVAAEFYDIPVDKIVVIPHSSYSGIYPEQLSRSEARGEMGLKDTDTAVLFLGQMRPYKGLGELLPALTRLGATRDDLVLLLAGKTLAADAAQIEQLMPGNIRVIRHQEHVPDAELQRWYRAADVVALPYRKVLNSGSAMLAATFGLPVLLPDLPHLRTQFEGESWVHFFGADADGGGLERALVEVQPLRGADAAAVRYAGAFPPAAMAAAFRELLERVRSEALHRTH